MSLKIARYISTIFVPPVPMLIIFSFLSLTLKISSLNFTVVFLTTLVFGFLAPILLFRILLKQDKIINHDATVKEQRTVPYLWALSFYVIGFLILYFFSIEGTILSFWLCYVTNMILVLVINKFWKISIHTIGIVGPVTLVVYITGVAFIPLFIIPLMVGWSRIKLKCHSLSQVLAGGLLAIFSTLFHIIVIKNLFL